MGLQFKLFNDSSTFSINFQKSSPCWIRGLLLHVLITDEATDTWTGKAATLISSPPDLQLRKKEKQRVEFKTQKGIANLGRRLMGNFSTWECKENGSKK